VVRCLAGVLQGAGRIIPITVLVVRRRFGVEPLWFWPEKFRAHVLPAFTGRSRAARYDTV